ncbi:Proline dehydrogenase / Delta-1-pyrroline-5-carboxylate dehydrogenase, partial [hydrothermal vent metagenome]
MSSKPFKPAELEDCRKAIAAAGRIGEGEALTRLVARAGLGAEDRRQISEHASRLVTRVRADTKPGLMEVFLAEYGLSTREGIALMCLAEALLRVPDAPTIDALIEDKIAPSQWGKHLGRSSSSLVNASTWALMLTGKVLDDDEEGGIAGLLRGAVKRLGEPVIRIAVSRAMRELGHQFVAGRTIGEAMENAAASERYGATFSYDMLGEAACTEADARRYHLAYSDAITALATTADGDDVTTNPGISVKLSALHPRYEVSQRERVMGDLVERTLSLALLAKSAGIGLNIDAEEAERLELSLDVIEAVISHPSLAGWDGFGVVVQTYGPRAAPVIDWLAALAGNLDRRMMVRLVKGAYWDTEIKRAQSLGLERFPVFTRKAATDVSFIACARHLLDLTDRLYPQFATHNAHSVAAILHMAQGRAAFEFQRLHGMGEALYDIVARTEDTSCRTYAPVGAHADLLAYLVRRLLENGANSSFVSQIVDESVPPGAVAADPFEVVAKWGGGAANPHITRPSDLFAPKRRNSQGWDLTDPVTLAEIDAARAPFRDHVWMAVPLIAGGPLANRKKDVLNPAAPGEFVGILTEASKEDIETAIAGAGDGVTAWSAMKAAERGAILRRAADLFEAGFGEVFALLAREAGKTLADCVGELREAVDFLCEYAATAEELPDAPPRGVVACISPWNFPLAIFTGQIAGALAAGNAVIAKPAEPTPLTAAWAVRLLHQAGVPRAALQLLPGRGATVGVGLTSDRRIDGVCFTGSTDTARAINRSMAEHGRPIAPLVAETGGLNAMIIDSTALPEQAVRDILASAFQSAGQRCSALRCLYIQSDVRDDILAMLFGAMDEFCLGDPWELATDIGPVIDASAKTGIEAHIAAARDQGRLLKQLETPTRGHFVAPAIIRIDGIADLKEEIFGPVLHVAGFEADGIGDVVSAINATGYGLTFGLHTRIDDRVQEVVEALHVGNTYVNRNQIGAVVGSQPFGGEGLSGTGPKAGGPAYVPHLQAAERPEHK